LVAVNLLEGQEYSERMFKKMLVSRTRSFPPLSSPHSPSRAILAGLQTDTWLLNRRKPLLDDNDSARINPISTPSTKKTAMSSHPTPTTRSLNLPATPKYSISTASPRQRPASSTREAATLTDQTRRTGSSAGASTTPSATPTIAIAFAQRPTAPPPPPRVPRGPLAAAPPVAPPAALAVPETMTSSPKRRSREATVPGPASVVQSRVLTVSLQRVGL